MNRISPIFTAREPSEVTDEITRLSDLYRKTQGRALPVNMLLFASWGERRNEFYGISLHWDAGQETQAKWVQQNVIKTVVST